MLTDGQRLTDEQIDEHHSYISWSSLCIPPKKMWYHESIRCSTYIYLCSGTLLWKALVINDIYCFHSSMLMPYLQLYPHSKSCCYFLCRVFVCPLDILYKLSVLADLDKSVKDNLYNHPCYNPSLSMFQLDKVLE